MKKTILIVDDYQDIADSISTFLKKEGYGIETFYTGRGAIRRSQSKNPDLLILDIAMPGFNGFEVARALPNQKIIFMTAYDFKEEDAKEFKNCVGLIEKPVDLEKLLSLVKKALK
ncbi:response regulator [Candidatus Woesearchaeota archaeon]|jgi:two-component system, OmpR family, response regulator|nr:response regulator [Candidatus Woesearchaeota archaeon]MBT4321751.1 response regulator [Candidatus Woesearchaeota archaeon]MBT4631157.1 response regulator [Candidatus Woesearchaeota archaeon]